MIVRSKKNRPKGGFFVLYMLLVIPGDSIYQVSFQISKEDKNEGI